MADKPLTLEDLKQATGVVGEPDQSPHPYGDEGHGKGGADVLKRLGADKPIVPGKGQ